MADSPIIYWFRQDLRLNDLPGLNAAIATGQPLICVYILDDTNPGDWEPGAASRWWLHHSLSSLRADLEALDIQLVLKQGDTNTQLSELVKHSGANAVYCTRCYEPWARELEETLHTEFSKAAIEFKRFPGGLLFEPEQIQNGSGLPFKVFTPFWKACLRAPERPEPKKLKKQLTSFSTQPSLTVDELDLLPTKPNWAYGWEEYWQPGEAGAHIKLKEFLKTGINDYAEGRNHPEREATSRLSAHMHYGEISPRTLWHEAKKLRSRNPELGDQIAKFLSEMGWREFSHHLLFHFPHIPEEPFKNQFSKFPWLGNPDHLKAWQKGQTGYPIVDAGMRELWQTGYMHNRVRMIVASFLTKHLLLPWRLGEDWFWDTLVDADLANNASGWQWVAGSGADASPYFRIFNPTLQGEKFDADGTYVRQWVPELAKLPKKWVHKPDQAPEDILKEAGVTLGENYPTPIVNHQQARQAALDAYTAIKN